MTALVSSACFATVCLVALVSEPGFQASSQQAPEQKLKDPQFISEGSKLFALSCGTGYCHGAGGTGGGGPRLRGKGLDPTYVFDAIANGIGGTEMPPFKSAYSEEQIWKMVAFILSPLKQGSELPVDVTPPPTVVAKPASGEASALLVGQASAGRALFFDSSQPKSCQACHSFDGVGASVGPDLAKIGSRSPRELFLKIISPRQTPEPRYRVLQLTLKDGEKIAGIKSEEDDESIRIYDTTSLPAVLRTIQKANIVKSDIAGQSPMPGDYASTYTFKQLLDLIAFLKSTDPAFKKGVTLKDLF